jgi:aryl-alcohol dehydrogenase-like predicted oxidoreductase
MGDGKKGLSKDHILRSADDSLRRLQTDYIDLYQSHKDDPDTPIEETLEAYDQLIKQGKVRAIGASQYTAARLAEALNVSKNNGLARYESLQPLYNLYDRAVYEDELEPLCVNEGLGVITFYSLAAGFLTGKYRSEDDLSKSARGGTVNKYLNERGFRIIDALDQVAAQYNATPAHVALAWSIARPSITAPIASATSLEQLNDLVEATRLELDQAAIELLDQASDEHLDKGKSYARTQTS